MWIFLKRFCTFLIIFLFAFRSCISAQVNQAQTDSIDYRKTQLVNLSFDFVDTKSGFSRKLGENGLGFSAFWMRQYQLHSPLFIGTEFFWHNYFVVGNSSGGFETRTGSGMMGIHAITRYFSEFTISFLEPFIEAFVGPKMSYSVERVFDESTNENVDFAFVDTDFSLSYGASLGLAINLSNYNYYLEGKLSYLTGTSTKFLARNQGNNQLFDSSGIASFLRYQIGVTAAF